MQSDESNAARLRFASGIYTKPVLYAAIWLWDAIKETNDLCKINCERAHSDSPTVGALRRCRTRNVETDSQSHPVIAALRQQNPFFAAFAGE